VACCEKNGILTYAFYIVGLPGETEQSTLDMIRFALALNTNAASFFMASPFHDTKLERWVEKHPLSHANDLVHLTSCIPSV
jgi:radical SAM superfamily enzyme